jgi:hypothetical protein
LLSYEVWFDDGNGDFSSIVSPIASTGPSVTYLNVTGLVTGLTYGIKTRTINQIGTS